MGMDLNIYVGPYLAYGKDAPFVDTYALTEERLCSVHDESDSGVRAILPNIGRFGRRFSRYDRTGEEHRLEPRDIDIECESFLAFFAADIARIKERTQVRVVWGIVSYWS